MELLFHNRIKQKVGKSIVTLHSDAYRQFAEELVGLRERAGLTQRELALRTGMAQSQVAKHELGTRRMDVIELKTVCQACGEPIEEFVRRLHDDAPLTSKGLSRSDQT